MAYRAAPIAGVSAGKSTGSHTEPTLSEGQEPGFETYQEGYCSITDSHLPNLEVLDESVEVISASYPTKMHYLF